MKFKPVKISRGKKWDVIDIDKYPSYEKSEIKIDFVEGQIPYEGTLGYFKDEALLFYLHIGKYTWWPIGASFKSTNYRFCNSISK